MRRLFIIIASVWAFGLRADVPDTVLQQAFARISTPDASRAALFDADPLTRDLLSWAILRGGHDDTAELGDHLRLMNAHPDWPVDRTMQIAAERVMTPQTPDRDILAYFAGRQPVTANGLAIFVQAQDNMGDTARGAAMLAAVWPTIALTQDEQDGLIAAFGPRLTAHHPARANELLWAGRTREARAMADLLPPQGRSDLAARLAYLENTAQAGALDVGQGDTPALAHARYLWLVKNRDRDGAIDLLKSRQGVDRMERPEAWARYRLRLARWALREGQGMRAHEVAARSALTSGADFAALEWFAGYVAYDALNAPRLALEHWQRMAEMVRTPVSRARAWYWSARAQTAIGDPAAARAAQIEAARYQAAFYGQIAAHQAQLPFDARLTSGVLQAVALDHDDPLLAALDRLVTARSRGLAMVFARHLGATAPPDVLRVAAARALAREDYVIALRIGKSAAARGVIIPEAYFPVHPLVDLPNVTDPALALAIARQESEFRTDAGSPVGALGVMQLMPATAEATARALGVPYQRANLIHDWRYNATLGAAHLEELKQRFGDSPVLIAAAYNAGSGRVYDWIAAHGDPRRADVDPVLWIEAIPFDETRNYVMRVIEALRPYEARLSGAAPTRSITDLLRGAYPLIRPRARPTALRQVMRPRARPGR